MDTTLPQVCTRCRQLKEANIGSYAKVKGQWSRRRWVCFACQPDRVFTRGRQRDPTPPERLGISILSRTGYVFRQEYQVGKFWFDFAIPLLRLLIEVDSRSYHHTPQQLSRDQAKRRLAEDLGWVVAHFNWKRDLDGQINACLARRATELEVNHPQEGSAP